MRPLFFGEKLKILLPETERVVEIKGIILDETLIEIGNKIKIALGLD
jgi:hypothetical protein